MSSSVIAEAELPRWSCPAEKLPEQKVEVVWHKHETGFSVEVLEEDPRDGIWRHVDKKHRETRKAALSCFSKIVCEAWDQYSKDFVAWKVERGLPA